MRDTTRLPKRRREKKLVENNDGTVSIRSVGRPLKHLKLVKQATLDMFTEEKRHWGGRSCLCGDLTILQYHDSKMYRTGKEQNCVVCTTNHIAPHRFPMWCIRSIEYKCVRFYTIFPMCYNLVS